MQQAFIDNAAVQCGYCAPGMLLSAKALLDRNPDPSEREIREGIAGNICRCTGYVKIVKAVQQAAVELRQRARSTRSEHCVRRPSGMSTKGAEQVMSNSVIGKSFPRSDAVLQVTGKSQYGEDVFRPGMLHAAILRSQHAHAKVLKIDTSAAEKLAGVKAVITSKDVPHNRFGFTHQDQPLLVDEKVRHFGDAVAAVAAESWEAAEEALAADQG